MNNKIKHYELIVLQNCYLDQSLIKEQKILTGMRNFLISSNACPILAYASAGGAKTSIKTCRSSFRWKYFASPLFLNSSSWENRKELELYYV